MGFSYYVLSFLNCIHFKKNPHSVVMTGWGLKVISYLSSIFSILSDRNLISL